MGPPLFSPGVRDNEGKIAMKVDKVFLSVNARDFAGLSEWWSTVLDRGWDREPMPSCHEWDVAGCVLFQVLDDAQASGTATVVLHVSELGRHVERLRQRGIAVPDPVKIDGFESLWYCRFHDPEGNEVGLLEGS